MNRLSVTSLNLGEERQILAQQFPVNTLWKTTWKILELFMKTLVLHMFRAEVVRKLSKKINRKFYEF